jgi:hypothetical protein
VSGNGERATPLRLSFFESTSAAAIWGLRGRLVGREPRREWLPKPERIAGNWPQIPLRPAAVR